MSFVKGKGKFLYSTLSNPQVCIRCIYSLHFTPCRPIQWNTTSTSLGSTQWQNMSLGLRVLAFSIHVYAVL